MKILFIRSRENAVFSHKIISFDIEETGIFDVYDIEEVDNICYKYNFAFVLHDRQRIDIIQQLRKKIKIACWSLEDPYELDKDLEICRKYDFVFSMDSAAVDVRNNLGQKNIDLLPLAVNIRNYYPDEFIDEKYISDILLVGVAFPKRIMALNLLTDFIIEKNLKLKIVGWWWEKLNNKYLEKQCVEKGIFSPQIIRKYYNGAKIILEINRDLYCTNIRKDAQTPGRAFNSLACKKFTISDRRKDTLDLFADDELITYNTIEDLKTKILYYLDAIDERETVEKKGYNRIINCHTIDKRMKQAKEILERNFNE